MAKTPTAKKRLLGQFINKHLPRSGTNFRKTLEEGREFAKQKFLEDAHKDEKAKALVDIYNDTNEILDKASLSELQANPPKQSEFPWKIFILAVIKDLIDIFSGSTLAWLFSIFVGIIMFFWLFRKVGFIKKQLLRWGTKRVILLFVADAVPILAFVPFASIFVILAHNRETKVVKILFAGLEALQGREGEIVDLLRKNNSQLLREAGGQISSLIKSGGKEVGDNVAGTYN